MIGENNRNGSNIWFRVQNSMKEIAKTDIFLIVFIIDTFALSWQQCANKYWADIKTKNGDSIVKHSVFLQKYNFDNIRMKFLWNLHAI